MAARSVLDRIIEGLRSLSDRRGSTARDLLAFVRGRYETPPRNLTMQVHRALKNGVADGSLRHVCGRYKLTINQGSFKQKGTGDLEKRKPARQREKPRNEVSKDKKLANKKTVESVDNDRSKRRERQRPAVEEDRKWRRERKRGKKEPGTGRRPARKTKKSERRKSSRKRR